jgi:uncharacterized damage-inducible protein DinB
MGTSKLLTSLFQYKAWANEEIFSSIMVLDETKHQIECHRAVRILNHIYVVDCIFVANLQRTQHPYTATNTNETPTLDCLLAAVRETDRWYLEYIAKLSTQELEQDIEFTFIDGTLARMSREEILAHIVTHGGYHRGAVGTIMAQLSVSPPRDIFSGFLHASEPTRRNRAEPTRTAVS